MKNIIILLGILLSYSSVIAQTTAKFEPPAGKVYHGVGQPPDGIQEYHTMLGDSTIYPLVYKLYYDIPGSRGNKFTELRGILAQQKAIGRLPELSLAFTDGTNSTDSAIATGTRYDAVIDSLAAVCRDFKSRMFVRIGFEFNGPWNKYHPYLYVTAFRKVVDRFRAAGAGDSCAFNWCYYPTGAPNDFDSLDARGARWYPGDSYVDWFGLDVFFAKDFHPDSAAMDRGVITSKGKSERFLNLATSRKKPVYLSETSAAGVNTSSDSQDGANDWAAWFTPFFKFISNHAQIKGWNYINWNWTKYPTWASWGDARIENSPVLSSNYRTEMRNPKYIHLKQAVTPPAGDTLPITELGLGPTKWKGFDGGLYPNRMNTRPPEHNTAGVTIAGQVVPLNAAGTRDDANGKIVLLSIGMSNATQEYSAFKQIADADTAKNPKVIVVDGAQGGQTASIIRDPKANFWTVVTQRLTQSGVDSLQVQVVWLKEANANPTQAFPVHAQMLKTDLKVIVGFLKQKFPNIKLCYLSSRTYGGYATSTLNPEPYAYESAFSVKWLIEEQIYGDDTLNYSGRPAVAPWLSWGPYIWADGAKPRQDNGLVWLPADVQSSDGTHPSTSGRQKVAALLLDFFKTDETTKPWFLKNRASSVNDPSTEQSGFTISPNPVHNVLQITIAGNGVRTVQIVDALGRTVKQCPVTGAQNSIDVSELTRGVYALRVGNAVKMFVKE